MEEVALGAFLGLLAGIMFTFIGVLTIIPMNDEVIIKEEPCKTELEDARTRNEVCELWEEEGTLVLGPRWLKEGSDG